MTTRRAMLLTVGAALLPPSVRAQDASPAIATPAASPAVTDPLIIVSGPQDEFSDSPVAGGTLRLPISTTALESLHPAGFAQDPTIAASYLDPLVMPDPATLEPGPWLATAWSWSADQRELTISLRDDVRWHDGTALTADDVAFTMEVYRDDRTSAVARHFAVVDAIAVRDERTVVLGFSAPDVAFIPNACSLPVIQRAQFLSAWEARPVGERTLEGWPWREHSPIGTGAWRFEEIGDERITLRRFDDHWNAAALGDQLELIAIDAPAARLEAWREGNLDLTWPVDGRAVDDLESTPATMHVAPSGTAYFAAFNFNNPARANPSILLDADVRAALQLAIDARGYAENVFGGYIDLALGGTMLQPWLDVPPIAVPGRNVGRANRMLDDASWIDRDGDGTRDGAAGDPLRLTCIVREDDDPGLLAILDRLDDDLEAVGSGCDIERLDVESFATRWTTTHDFDLLATSLTVNPTFAEFDLYGSDWDIRTNLGGWNPGGYANADVDAAIADWLATADEDAGRKALARLQEALAEDPFALWFGSPQRLVLVQPDVRGFAPGLSWPTTATGGLWRTPAGDQ